MNKKKLMALLSKKEARKAELVKKSDASEDVAELRSIGEDLDTINAEITELRGIIDATPDDEEFEHELEERGATQGEFNPIATYGMGNGQTSADEKREKDLEKKFEARGADLKAKKTVTFDIEELPEFRAVTIGGGSLVVEKKYSQSINDTFNQVSKTIDLVNAIPLNGGESYEKAFEVSSGEGDYTTENGEYKDTDPEFDYVTIGKAKITAYTEMSDEAMKLPNVNYQALVAKNISESIRKKISKQILVGPGGANSIKGIFNAPANVIPAESDIEISDIDENTLDKIVFGYGGDEDVEGGAYLILNKRDLAKFAEIRTDIGEKQYKIELNGNTGTISSSGSYKVPFVINSATPALTAAGTANDTYCMAYGMMHCYEMPVFSPVTVEESRDFKFKSGQIAYRGSVWAGGSVAMYKGFVRVKKIAVA